MLHQYISHIYLYPYLHTHLFHDTHTTKRNLLQMVNHKTKKMLQRQRNRVSFSANMPDDVRGAIADSICVVKYSMDPLTDIRESIKEMVKIVGIKDWKEMEELVYCYIVLNSKEVHSFIQEAFLSLCT
ncbi:hypothetical protein CQW23_15579 [Capsicum baccatum]|uniref:Transcription repressor n=1 Tax=Capsicum baccatum TaxID=33114 RepID=A0A2G2WMH2_CAPBA|nr:hypothetical protein CQW23_15579 [Capsicum baccatum]